MSDAIIKPGDLVGVRTNQHQREWCLVITSVKNDEALSNSRTERCTILTSRPAIVDSMLIDPSWGDVHLPRDAA